MPGSIDSHTVEAYSGHLGKGTIMTQEKINEQSRDQNKRKYIYAGVGLILGSALGFTLGGPVTAAMGAGIGLVIGAAVDANRSKVDPKS